MASVFLKRGKYYLRYKDAHGRWISLASSASTKTEARRLAEDLERREERVRLGVERPLVDAPKLCDALVSWLEAYCKGKPSYAKSKKAIDRHLLTAKISGKRLNEISPGEIEELLLEKGRTLGPKGKVLGPQSLNHLRGFLRRAFGSAMKRRRFLGPNPVDEVPVWKVSKPKHDFLRPEEVIPVLRALSTDWRPLFATAIYTGLRKGELFGLRKEDVDLRNRTITVCHSYERETTKGGHWDTIPIATELVPFLEYAIAMSRSELVFPRADGSMRAPSTQMEQVLRRALRRAGICLGYDHKCRAKGCGHVERHADAEPRRCPIHCHKMWPSGLVRPIRFHDLRHTTGSLLAMMGVDTPALQKILRHRDPRLTMGTYVHLRPSFLRAEINRLHFGVEPRTQANTDEKPDPFVTRLLPGAVRNDNPGDLTRVDAEAFPEVTAERDTGVEPATFSLGS